MNMNNNMLSKSQFFKLKPDEIAEHHGYLSFIDFIMKHDLDKVAVGILTYDSYQNWYVNTFTSLGRALNE